MLEAMTLLPKPDTTLSEDFRRDMLRLMSEVSNNPANVVPERQEELAMFMVRELKAFYQENTFESERWTPDLPPPAEPFLPVTDAFL